jgi:hypothetical protein
MNFGKFKGRLVQDCPRDYLTWVWNNVGNLDPWLKQAIGRWLDNTDDFDDPCPPRQQQTARHPPPADVKTIVRKWYSEVSMRWHPDRGGNHQAMVAITDAYERLKRALDLK